MVAIFLLPSVSTGKDTPILGVFIGKGDKTKIHIAYGWQPLHQEILQPLLQTGWIAASGPPSKIGQKYIYFWHFSVPWTNLPEMVPNGPGSCFFLLIQALPTFWATRILILRFCIFWILGFPDFWISRFLDSQILGCHLVISVRGGNL